MNRRHFLLTAGAAPLSGLFAGSAHARAFPGMPDGLFDSDSPEVLALATRVMEKCVLDKLREPTPPLRHTWVAPGGPHYLGQWIWDTMFVVDLLAILPETERLIRDIFLNYWDAQDRWHSMVPAFAHDMIPVAIKTDPQEQRRFSQIPLLAWGVERVFKRNGDKRLLELCLNRLEKFHEWFWRERDLHDNGLITLGSYSGEVQHARWETFDYECNMDDMKMTVHPSRKGGDEGAWYADICVPGNNAYLIMAERSLARLAETMGDKAMAARRMARVNKGVEGMRKHLWDETAGTFLSVRRDSLEKIPVATIGSWIPLAAGVPTAAQAGRMAETLASPAWQTPLPVPTVDRRDRRWKSNSFWRGDVWPPTNYQIATGLAAYGHHQLAADIADKTIANAVAHGLSEHYDSVTGKALGVPDYSMCAAMVAMMLDGLTRKHRLTLREAHTRSRKKADI
jgi:hypothetical protein